MTSTISIYTADGDYITELNTSIKRTWERNSYGECEFKLSIYDDNATQQVLQYGNFVLIDHDRLPIWAGYIDTPMTWIDGIITVKVYQVENMLDHFVTGQTESVNNTNALVAKFLIERYVSPKIKITFGKIESDELYTTETQYRYNSILECLRNLTTDDDFEFHLDPKIGEDRKLYFEFSYVRTRGSDTLYEFCDGADFDLSSSGFVEQGYIANKIFIYGGGEWGLKPYGSATDKTSFDTFGYRALVLSREELINSTKLDKIAQKILVDYKKPRKTFQLSVLDIGVNFNYLVVGNRVYVTFTQSGFNWEKIYCTVETVTFDDANNFADAILREREPIIT